MNKEEFLKGITYLGLAYSKEITQEQLSVWYSFFRDDDFNSFRDAIKRICVKNKFFPSIADLKSEMAETAIADLPADEAWNHVLKAVSKYGYYQAEEAVKSLPDLTRSAVSYLGGFQKICQSDSGEWLRKDFVKIYEDLKTRHITKYVTGDAITIADVIAKKKLLESKEEEK